MCCVAPCFSSSPCLLSSAALGCQDTGHSAAQGQEWRRVFHHHRQCTAGERSGCIGVPSVSQHEPRPGGLGQLFGISVGCCRTWPSAWTPTATYMWVGVVKNDGVILCSCALTTSSAVRLADRLDGRLRGGGTVWGWRLGGQDAAADGAR